MRTIFTTLLSFALFAAHASAQSSVAVSGETSVPPSSGAPAVAAIGGKTPLAPLRGKSPVAAARGKTIEIGLGYTYMSQPENQSKRVGLQGADASFTVGFSRLGIKADLGYARAANVLGTGSHSDVLSYLAGPVFHPISNRNFDIYIHALAGGARVSGPILTNGGVILLGGWATGYAWATGGGVKYWLSDSLAVSTGADFLRTAYYDPSLKLRGQYNLRTTATVIYYFGMRSGKMRWSSR